MFTGIIRETGIVRNMMKSAEGAELWVGSSRIFKQVQKKDSIAVQGVCLTVVTLKEDICIFTLSPETLETTNLGKLKPGSPVNLELPLSAGDPLGGHFVLGHADGIGTIMDLSRTGNALRIEISVPNAVEKYLVQKGSIAVDGISLTIASVKGKSFSAVILPLTAEATTLKHAKKGDQVNLEGDILAKYIFRYMESTPDRKPGKETINEEFLRRFGYLEKG